MKKNEFEFKDEQLDSFKYSEKLAELQNISAEFDAAINILRENNLPADEKSIKEHFCTELGLRLYLNSLAETEIKKAGGYLIEEQQKTSILNTYKQLFDDVKGIVPVFNKILNKGLVKVICDTDGNLSVDEEYNKHVATIYATYHINGEDIKQYHTMCLQMAEMRKELKEFEESHNIKQHFGLGVMFNYPDRFGGLDVMRGMMIDDYFANHDNNQLWLSMFANYFRTNGTTTIKEDK
jgi:hypothetical protein